MPQETGTLANYRETASYRAALTAIHNVSVDKTLMERVSYSDDSFPLGVRTDIYRYFIDRTVNCHWHSDFEFGVLLSGEVDFYINDTYVKLREGDAYFVNSNILHMGKQTEGSGETVMYTLAFPASLLCAGTNGATGTVYRKYLNPLLNTQAEGFVISGEYAPGTEIRTLLMKIYQLEPAQFGYELKCLETLSALWLATLKYIEDNKGSLLFREGDKRYTDRMKRILSYIHENYSHKITAQDIADHVSISRSECFRCFKHFMNKRLVEYVNEYRLQMVAKLLRETERSITDISSECGFENASYFGKVFREAYSMSPMQYKKAQVWTDNTERKINGYDYEFYKNTGSGTMIITSNANNGSFLCQWSDCEHVVFRSGIKFPDYEKTHSQLGSILLRYDADYSSQGSSWFGVYGWTVNPLVEFYIIEHHVAYNLLNMMELQGSFETDGDTYEIYRFAIKGRSTIIGVRDFVVYASVRASGRSCGTVDVSAHFRAWEKAGLPLGKLTEVSLSVRGLESSGNASIRTNVISIG